MSVAQENMTAVEVAAPGTFTAPRVVRVNLVPAEIHEAASRRRVQLAALGIVLLGAAVGAALYVNANSSLSDAKSTLAQQQAINTSLTAEKGRLGDVTSVENQYAGAIALQASVTAPRIDFASYLTDLQLLTPNNLWYTNVAFSEDLSKLSVAGAPAAGTHVAVGLADPSTVTGSPTVALPGYPAINIVATMNITGVTTDIYSVASEIDALNKVNGAAHTSLSTATVATTGSKVSSAAGQPNNTFYPVAFSMTTNLTADALESHHTGAQ